MDIEDLCDKITSTLQTDLGRYLSMVELEKASSYGLQPPDPVNGYGIGEVLTPDLPFICVIPQEDTTRRDESQYRLREYSVLVECYLGGDDNQALTRKIVRFAEAIDRALQNSGNLGGAAKDVALLKRTYSGPMKHPKAGLLQGVRVELRALLFTD